MEIKKKPVASAQAHIGRTKYQTIITGTKHSIIADEPEAIGGTDTGPNPHDLLLASLGSCTAITLRMYLDRKMWPVDEVLVNLGLFETAGGILIERQLTFTGELTEEQKKRLIQIADSCPMHRLLTGKITIETGIKQ